jgi:hypothetical protein
LKPGEWEHLVYAIPSLNNVCLAEAGIVLVPVQEERRHLQLPSLIAYIDDFSFSGKPNYFIDFSSERIEK